MKVLAINITFQRGQDAYFEMHPDGMFHYNATPVILDGNHITGIGVCMTEHVDPNIQYPSKDPDFVFPEE